MSVPFDCPRCGTLLTMSERAEVEIDYCPQCRGVWLDRGELDKIIERVASELSAGAPRSESGTQQIPTSPRWGGSHDGGHRGGRYGGHRRKSWLHEIFG